MRDEEIPNTKGKHTLSARMFILRDLNRSENVVANFHRGESARRNTCVSIEPIPADIQKNKSSA